MKNLEIEGRVHEGSPVAEWLYHAERDVAMRHLNRESMVVIFRPPSRSRRTFTDLSISTKESYIEMIQNFKLKSQLKFREVQRRL